MLTLARALAREAMASFRVAEEVFEELMRLTGKTRLRCDGKIYKETRNLSLGDYVLSQVAVREMGLAKEDDDSPAVVGQSNLMLVNEDRRPSSEK